MTIQNIIEKERLMSLEAEKKYGEYFFNAIHFNMLLQNSIQRVKPKAWIFVIFLSQVKKHHILALLSIIRLHHIQAMMDLRQVLEAGANAAYAIANPNEESFAKIDTQGILKASQKLTKKRYEWLEQNYPKGSDSIKDMKGVINESSAHSNIIYSHKNFKYGNDGQFETPFFDFEDDYLIKTDLWLTGNIALGLMDLFWGVNRDYNLITFSKDFTKRLHELQEGNNKLKEELMRHKRFRK